MMLMRMRMKLLKAVPMLFDVLDCFVFLFVFSGFDSSFHLWSMPRIFVHLLCFGL